MCPTRPLILVWLAAAAPIGAAFAQRPPQRVPFDAQAAVAPVCAALGLASATLQSIVPMPAAAGAIDMQLTIDGLDVTLVAEQLSWRKRNADVSIQHGARRRLERSPLRRHAEHPPSDLFRARPDSAPHDDSALGQQRHSSNRRMTT